MHKYEQPMSNGLTFSRLKRLQYVFYFYVSYIYASDELRKAIVMENTWYKEHMLNMKSLEWFKMKRTTINKDETSESTTYRNIKNHNSSSFTIFTSIWALDCYQFLPPFITASSVFPQLKTPYRILLVETSRIEAIIRHCFSNMCYAQFSSFTK